MNEEKKEKVVNSGESPIPDQKMRCFSIETDGNKIRITKNELVGLLELKAVLTELLTNIR